MDKELLLTLLSALRIEIITAVLFAFGLRFGLRKLVSQKGLLRMLVGWAVITFTTLFVFIYVAYFPNSNTPNPTVKRDAP